MAQTPEIFVDSKDLRDAEDPCARQEDGSGPKMVGTSKVFWVKRHWAAPRGPPFFEN